MKKILILTLLHLPTFLFSQATTESQSVKSKVEVFSQETGVVIETTVEEIGKVGYSLSVKVIKLKNMITGTKTAGILLQWGNHKNILDADEIDGLVKSLAIMKDASNTTKPFYTELNYKSRTGIEIGAYYDYEKNTQYIANHTEKNGCIILKDHLI